MTWAAPLRNVDCMSHPAFPGGLHREDPDLSPRQREVFAAVIELHGASAHPVGSETLADLGRIALSSASIRNELAGLESAGLLERTHASAGRVPSVKGYEYYVRTLVVPAVLPADLVERVNETCRNATLGCVEDKRRMAELINAFLDPIRKKREDLEKNPEILDEILKKGTERASRIAAKTLERVQKAMKFI